MSLAKMIDCFVSEKDDMAIPLLPPPLPPLRWPVCHTMFLLDRKKIQLRLCSQSLPTIPIGNSITTYMYLCFSLYVFSI